MTLLGYARVSRADQNLDLQVDALTTAGCERVWVEHTSGARASRPELDKLLAFVREGDTLVVWRLDRLGRSLRHLIDLMTWLGGRGVQFRSLTEGMDTSTPTGVMLFHIFGAIAEFERAIIRERTLAGLAASRARGRPPGGRRCKLSSMQVASVRQMAAEGKHSISAIAAMFVVSRATVYRILDARPGDPYAPTPLEAGGDHPPVGGGAAPQSMVATPPL